LTEHFQEVQGSTSDMPLKQCQAIFHDAGKLDFSANQTLNELFKVLRDMEVQSTNMAADEKNEIERLSEFGVMIKLLKYKEQEKGLTERGQTLLSLLEQKLKTNFPKPWFSSWFRSTEDVMSFLSKISLVPTGENEMYASPLPVPYYTFAPMASQPLVTSTSASCYCC